MAEIRASSLPFKQVITVEPKSSIAVQFTMLGAFSTLRISCAVEAGEVVGVAGGAMKLLGALRGKSSEQSKQSISDIGISVSPFYGASMFPSYGTSVSPSYDALDYDILNEISFSPFNYGSRLIVTGSRTIEIPIFNVTGEWGIALDNAESKATQKIVSLTLEEISWKEGPPIELTFEVPSRDMRTVTFPVASQDCIRIKAGVPSSDIDVYLVSQDNVVGNTVAVNLAYLKHQKTSGFTEVYECAKNENLTLVFDNRKSRRTSKTVNVSICLESKGSDSSVPRVEKQVDVVTAPSVFKETIKETVKEIYLIICPHCNHKNEAGNRFCGKCGASI